MDFMSFPVPSAKEMRNLAQWVDSWDVCSDLQRAICVVLVRGVNQPKRIATQLHVGIDSIKDALPGISGFVVDAETGHLFLP